MSEPAALHVRPRNDDTLGDVALSSHGGGGMLGKFLRTIRNRAFRHVLRSIRHGQLTVVLPSGENLVCGGKNPGPRAALEIHSWKFLRFIVTGSELDFAQSYIAGEWTTSDLTSVLKFLGQNAYSGAPLRGLKLSPVLSRLQHALNRNTRQGSRRNIAAHYDLGNAFYSQWLDKSMTYSSALYGSAGQTLAEAQQNKLSRVVELLDLAGGETILEIGSGWGSLAERLASYHGCSVTGLTLSIEQLACAKDRVTEREGRGRCNFLLQDYRDIDGTYDRTVSIEMLEAVGEAYWPVYFAKLHDSLRAKGIAVLQVISIGQAQFGSYQREPDFIQRYIFPGGMLPTVDIVKQQIAAAGLRLESAEFFGDSYARTLEHWRTRFLDAWPTIATMGFDPRFRRMWEYYLAYCQAGFEIGALNVGLYKIVRSTET